MADVVNLRTARKVRARADREVEAAANRAKHGRTKAEKQADDAEQERRTRALAGARIERD